MKLFNILIPILVIILIPNTIVYGDLPFGPISIPSLEDGLSIAPIRLSSSSSSSTQSNNNHCWDCIAPIFGMDKNNKLLVKDGFRFNENSTDVLFFHTPYPLIITSTNQTNTLAVKIYENQGIENIMIVQFGLGLPEVGSAINSAETLVEIYFDIFTANIERVEIRDKHNLIDNSFIINSQQVSCSDTNQLQCLEVSLEYVYRESPMSEIVMISVSDKSRNTSNNYFNDGIQVIGASLNPLPTTEVSVGIIRDPQYPQQRGLVELTQIDRKNQLWRDIFGYIWQDTLQGFTLKSEIYHDPRNHISPIQKLLQIESQKAQKVLESYHRILIIDD